MATRRKVADPESEFCTVRDIQRRYSVSERTVRRWLENGLRHYKIGPGQQGGIRIKRADVEAWVESCAVEN